MKEGDLNTHTPQEHIHSLTVCDRRERERRGKNESCIKRLGEYKYEYSSIEIATLARTDNENST
jgi:hypothetical protein